MKIKAICIGKPEKYIWKNKEIYSSIFKKPIGEDLQPIRVYFEHIEGDEQHEKLIHGGLDQAVYGYSYSHYDWWLKELGMHELPFGAFGENLTIEEFDEKNIYVGDCFKVGSVILQARIPREPCVKLDMRHQRPVMAAMIKSGFCGVYMKVIQEGFFRVGDCLEKIMISKENPSDGKEFLNSDIVDENKNIKKLSIHEMFQFAFKKWKMDSVMAHQLLQISDLTDDVKNKILLNL